MSANLYWHPVKRGRDLPCSAPSVTIEALGYAFGGGTQWRLGKGDIATLRGMVAASPKGSRGTFEEIIEAIEKHGDIDVWAQY